MPQMSILFLGYAACSVLIYWVIPASVRRYFLALSGSVFLAALDLISFGLLAVLTSLIYFSAERADGGRGYDALALAVLILLFCGVRIAQLLQRMDQSQHWLVFLGFGFYVLKLIHYRIERRGDLFRPHGFLQFYNYMLFFPTITIGPINRFDEFQRSERRIRWDDATFAQGLERILYGYAKVVILANWLMAIHIMPILSRVSANDAIALFLDSMSYGLHLYFTFAGVSDIAIGLGLLFGYRVGENFDRPFLKPNIAEFWQSWHMSLSSWCRQYVFLPMYSRWRHLGVAMVATMMTLGLWHEFSGRFLLWGVYHGLGIAIFRWYQRRVRSRFPAIQHRLGRHLTHGAAVAFTFIFVMIGFTIPRSESVSEIVENFRILLGGG